MGRKTQLMRSAKLALFTLLLTLPLSQAKATTITFDSGQFIAHLVPVGHQGETDFIQASILGSLDYNLSSGLATLALTFNGSVLDNVGGAVVGSINGSINYIYENVRSETLVGNQYILATDPQSSLDDNGNGVGSFANLTLTQNNQTTQAVFDLQAKQYRPTNAQIGFDGLSPVTEYLVQNGLGAYLMAGILSGHPDVTGVFAWMMSDVFKLGTNRYGNKDYMIFTDVHGQSAIPEPASMLLLGLGALGGIGARKRNRTVAV